MRNKNREENSFYTKYQRKIEEQGRMREKYPRCVRNTRDVGDWPDSMTAMTVYLVHKCRGRLFSI